MKLLLLNLLVLLMVVFPLVVLEAGKHRVGWLRKNHDGLSVIVWLLTLFLVYLFVLPRLGLVPNQRFFEN